jgi:UDP-glucose 4-epimerase
MAENVLVTGGAGFIGSHIVDALIASGHDVAVLDNLHTGRRENVNVAARFYNADIRDASELRSIFAIERPTVLCHQAALANVRDSLDHPDAYAETNVIGMLRLLETARSYGVRKVLFASTGGAIYGEVSGAAAREELPPHPLDPYGVSKLACEHYLYTYRHNYGLEYCALRYGNVYGPRQNTHGEAGVVAIFAGRMLSKDEVVINGDGNQRRDFVYVGDIARANILALAQDGGLYNLGTGVATDINTIYRKLADLTGYLLPEVHVPAKLGEVRTSCLDAGKAHRELNWEPQVSLSDGLARVVEHVQSIASVKNSGMVQPLSQV